MQHHQARRGDTQVAVSGGGTYVGDGRPPSTDRRRERRGRRRRRAEEASIHPSSLTSRTFVVHETSIFDRHYYTLLTTVPADPTACFFPWCSVLSCSSILASRCSRLGYDLLLPSPPSRRRVDARRTHHRSDRRHGHGPLAVANTRARVRLPPSRQSKRQTEEKPTESEARPGRRRTNPRPGQTPPPYTADASPSLPSLLLALLCSARLASATHASHRRSPPPMGTPQRPRPRQLARTNAMRNSSYTADAGADGDGDLAAYGGIQLSVDRAARASRGAGAGYASQTSFRIHGGRGGGEEVAELFRQLGLSGPEDFAIPPAVYAAANAARRRASLEESSPAASPSGVPEISGRDVIVASRLQPAGDGEEAGLATELVQSETIQVSAKAYQRPWAESEAILVESERVETSTREVAAVSEPENAGEEKGGDKLAKVETLREERTREVVVEATREKATGALALVVAESNSCDIEHLVSPSPNRRFRRTITSWIKGEHIGSGSFGSVYEAISDDGFFFAVKEVSLLDQGINAKQRIVQLEHEVSLLSRLEHDNIVQYYGTDKEDGKLYIFLELVTQGSLAALYQKYCLQDSQVSAYTRQILNGLNYLHQRNVLHRDIKCANILVDANGLVKLADFGLAKEMSILSQARSSKGTVFWMAPEVAKAKPHGPPADIWSLGCTVLEMLTGKVPYPDMEWTHALLKIGRGIPPKIPNTLSEDARDFIAKCVQANQKDRPSAAQLLEHPFVKRPLHH
ncbi:hypothetical protein ACQJBY_055785 [Aegilops geniculata]